MSNTKKPSTSYHSLAWPLGVLILLSTIAAIAALNQAAKFKQYSQPSTSTDQLSKKIIQPTAFFYTKLFLDRDKTNISFPFKFGQDPLTVYLLGQSQKGEYNISRLVYHPSFETLDWNYVSDNTYQLYQKNPTFASVEDFVNNPPKDAVILADRQIVALPQFSHINTVEISDDPKDINLDNVDYIFTTYKPIRKLEGLYNYEDIIDATILVVNSNNELVWQLQIPLATESNPFYLGEIHVNYQ